MCVIIVNSLCKFCFPFSITSWLLPVLEACSHHTLLHPVSLIFKSPILASCSWNSLKACYYTLCAQISLKKKKTDSRNNCKNAGFVFKFIVCKIILNMFYRMCLPADLLLLSYLSISNFLIKHLLFGLILLPNVHNQKSQEYPRTGIGSSCSSTACHIFGYFGLHLFHFSYMIAEVLLRQLLRDTRV